MMGRSRAPRRQKLFNSIVRNLPSAFVDRALVDFPLVQRMAAANTAEDSFVGAQYKSYVAGQLGHFYLQTAFHRVAESTGVAVILNRTASSYPYAVVTTGPFIITVSAVDGPSEMPDAADFRAGLAAHNKALEDPVLFESMIPSAFYKKHKLYALITFTPGHAATNTPDQIRIGLPNEALNGWHFQYSMKDVAIAQQHRATRRRDVEIVDQVALRIRRHTGRNGEQD
jgi:hypothetical protein